MGKIKFEEEVNVFAATAATQSNVHSDIIDDGSIGSMEFECVSIVQNEILFKKLE